MRQYKVGDKVNIKQSYRNLRNASAVNSGTIVYIEPLICPWPYRVKNEDGKERVFSADEIELAGPSKADLEEAVRTAQTKAIAAALELEEAKAKLAALPPEPRTGKLECFAVVNKFTGECISRHDNLVKASRNWWNQQGPKNESKLEIIRYVEVETVKPLPKELVF